MAAPGQSHKSFALIGKESAYGSAVAGTKVFEIMSQTMAPVLATIPDPSLNNAPSRRGLFQGGYSFAGKITVRLSYQWMLPLFEGVFGSATDAVVSAPASSHTFKEASLLPSYTICIQDGAPAGVATVSQYTGCKIASVVIKATAGTGADAFVTAEFEVLARDVTLTGGTLVAYTLTGPEITLRDGLATQAVFPVLYHHANPGAGGTVDNGLSAAASVRVRSFEVTLTNNLSEDRWYLGSLLRDEPLRNDFLAARWKFVEEFQDRTLYSAAKLFTNASPQLIFQDPGTAIITTYRREFELRSNKAQWSEYGNPVEGYGIVLANHTVEGYYDSSDASALVARFQSAETTTN